MQALRKIAKECRALNAVANWRPSDLPLALDGAPSGLACAWEVTVDRTVVRGGLVVDGSGAPARTADIVIEGGYVATYVPGQRVLDGGVDTGVRPGRVLRRRSAAGRATG
jgi:N-acyl-D-aspartate/D-glutamate deacylase